MVTNSKQISLRSIQYIVAAAYGLEPARLKDKCKEPRIAEPRQICAYLAFQLTKCSYPKIGLFFSQHHTTVMHSCRKVGAIRMVDKGFSERLNELAEMVRNSEQPDTVTAAQRRTRLEILEQRCAELERWRSEIESK